VCREIEREREIYLGLTHYAMKINEITIPQNSERTTWSSGYGPRFEIFWLSSTPLSSKPSNFRALFQDPHPHPSDKRRITEGTQALRNPLKG